MCESTDSRPYAGSRTIPVERAVGSVLAHDVTEIRKGEFKGAAFRKGHVIRPEDVCRLQRLGKERVFVLSIGPGELHEDDAARMLADALSGEGVAIKGEPREGKVTIVADRDGILYVDREALAAFNVLGEVMCATLHTHTVVQKGQAVAGTRAIPLVLRKSAVDEAVRIAENGARKDEEPLRSGKGPGIVSVKEIRRPRAGVVITGNEVFHGRVPDAFAPIIRGKIESYGGELIGTYYAPDDEQFIAERLRELLSAGADLLITTGGMSVDPDDVTRFAISSIGAQDIAYGSAALPGAMVLVAYAGAERGMRSAESSAEHAQEVPSALRIPHSEHVPILGIPACSMYHKTTVFDLLLPRILAGEHIGRRELADLGHGGLCLHCAECRYPVCPFGKQ